MMNRPIDDYKLVIISEIAHLPRSGDAEKKLGTVILSQPLGVIRAIHLQFSSRKP